MDQRTSFTLREVIDLGFEAYHIAEGGVWWMYHGCLALRSDPISGVRTLILDVASIPDGPWHPTAWGEMELECGSDGEV